jgi:hypothetical protein
MALHPEVVVTIKVNVARTAEEAEAQAQGAVLTGAVSDRAEARAAAQALLEEEVPTDEEPASTRTTGAGPDESMITDKSLAPNSDHGCPASAGMTRLFHPARFSGMASAVARR